jgi:hypothetical protein
MPYIESPIPQPTAEEREPILMPFDPNEFPKNYPNRIYEFIHQVIKRERMLDAFVEQRGDQYLILLPSPILGASISSDYTITFTAALMHLHKHCCDGWLVSSHEAALAVWKSP